MPTDIRTFGLFFLVLVRLSVFVFMFPFFNSRVFPPVIKAGLSVVLAVALFPALPLTGVTFPQSLLSLMGFVLVEFVMGLVLGLMVQFFFESIRIMGHIVGFETGFAIANVFDPQSGSQISLFANFSYFLAMALFLLINGHHVLIFAMKESFALIPMGGVTMDRGLLNQIISVSGRMFLIAVKIGAPAIAALMLVKVGFGLITKLVPQVNIMIVAFPVQIGVGLFFFGLCLEVLRRFMENYVGHLGRTLVDVMTRLGGG